MNVLDIPVEFLNRAGRRERIARFRKMPMTLRKEAAARHDDHQKEKRAEGLAYRIAKVKRDVKAIKAFQKKHPKLKQQFREENKKLGI